MVQARQDKAAARKLMRKLLKKQGIAPTEWVTDKYQAYGSALRELGISRGTHLMGKRLNNRASLFGRLRSSAFRRSDRQSSNCPTGSCFSPEPAPRPLHDGVRRMRRNDLKSVLLRP